MILEEILEVLKNNGKDIAYIIGEKQYTYSELYKYVCNIYHYLLENNKEKKPVLVYGHKDIYMKATFLACSYAGMAYVPVDESMPEERIKEIINQIKPKVIIGNLQNGIKKEQVYTIMENENYTEITKISMKPEDTYYIIFTSGSTGKPKGVEISYNNLNSCVNWLKEIAGNEKGVILNQANFSFDLSIADFYLSLVTGSAHFILENNSKFNFEAIFKELKRSNASLAVMTPSFADLLLLDKSFSQELMLSLKKIIFCGEKLSIKTAKKLLKRFENIEIVNCYGPTECTFAVTSISLNKNNIEIFEDLPVGSPKKDVEIYIVDENLKETDLGEILITGASVTKGYLEESKSFIDFKGEKCYLTGDIGYFKDGLLYYKQRKDKQIKYKGYRIELTDIENNILNLEYVEKAVVVAKHNIDGNILNIIAFVKTDCEVEKIKQDLKKKLPDYMMPKIRIVDNFPLNNNGKCDEKRLLEEY